MTVNIIATIILIAVIGSAVFYIIKSKKKGVKCVGCPHGKTCGYKKDGVCGCGFHNENSEI